MAYTFSDAKTYLRNYNREAASTPDEQKIVKIINDANRSFRAYGEWDFDRRFTEYTFAAPYSTGTLSATNASTTLTGSGTTWATAMTGRFIRINGEPLIYKFTYVSSTSGTIAPAYRGDTASSLSYEILHVRTALPTHFRSVHEVQLDEFTYCLKATSLEDVKRAYKKYRDISEPRNYALEFDSGDPSAATANVTPTAYLWVYPAPSAQRVVELAGYYWPFELSEDSHVFGIPQAAEGVLREFQVAFLKAEQGSPDAREWLGRARREADIALAAHRMRRDYGQQQEWTMSSSQTPYMSGTGSVLGPGEPSHI